MDISQSNLPIIGAVVGDILGSSYEFHPQKRKDILLCTPRDRFTDDTVCTVAITYALKNNLDFASVLKNYCRNYPKVGYGHQFYHWFSGTNSKPYNSWGNGSAMRVSACGAYATSVEDARSLARKSAEITHNHPEGIKGAEATASAIYIAKEGFSKAVIKDYIEQEFGYDLSRKLDDIRPKYKFEVSCQKSVPEAIICFLQSDNYEDAIRNAISLGGDADTQSAISGAIAAAFYNYIPEKFIKHMSKLVTDEIYEDIS